MPTSSPSLDPIPLRFWYVEKVESFAVPSNVIAMIVTLHGSGAQHSTYSTAYSTGGKGAKVVSTLQVTPGDVYYVKCGGMTGYNGGGAGYAYVSKPGGGATDIRTNVTDLFSRVVVAGGGGGSHGYCGANGGDAGQVGADGFPELKNCCCTGGGTGGKGGTLTAGGVHGSDGGTSGSFGQGGNGLAGGPGGGGGYFGLFYSFFQFIIHDSTSCLFRWWSCILEWRRGWL